MSRLTFALLTAIVATLAWAFLFSLSRSFRGFRNATLIKRHLWAFGWAWVLLSFYYWSGVAVLLLDRPWLLDWPPPAAHSRGVAVFHGWTLLVCWITNTALLRAVTILEPETDRIKGRKGGPAAV